MSQDLQDHEEPQGSPAPQPDNGTEQAVSPVPDPDGDKQEAQATPPAIESASATTSPENNRSGAAPYVIAGVTILCLLLFATGCSALLSIPAHEMASYSRGLDSPGDSPLDLLDEDSDDLDGLLDELEGLRDGDEGEDRDDSSRGYGYDDGSRGSGSRRGANTDLTADNVFDQELYCLDESVGSYVFASDYDGSQATVAQCVRALVKADDTATSQAQTHLRAAASTDDEGTRASELDAAIQLCAQARDQIGAVAIPQDISGSRASEVADDLADARESLSERWADVGKVLEIMRSPDGHTSRELSEVDEDASDLLDIGLELSDALYLSASNK